MKHYTEEEINFLKINYPIFGGSYCSLHLNKTKNSILAKVKRLNLYLDDDIKSKIKSNNSLGWYNKIDDDSYNVGCDQFKNINTPEIAYILGFIWSDGSFNKNKYHNDIRLEIVKKDLDEIRFIFDKVGKWGYYTRKRKNKKETAILKTSNRPLLEYLYSLDFNKKSFVSPDKLIQKIPENLQYYFFRGIIDGDGCFYNGINTMIFSVTSSINQDWNYLENLYKKLNVKYTIRQKNHKNKNGTISQSSIIEVIRIEDIIKIGDYIYADFDEIGLMRKYKKYLSFINRNNEIDKNNKAHKKHTF
jgi:hypothetical protein